ncbi:uncharacterized protein affecting Mg2+/Co2+ transport [Hahella chejuensis KCTC 2396]|uniref:Protein ApaG n=1 Tax=Hahella chejuensis (strain KCTC 2396) TaxID=349521 RepID=Q2S9C4_HAHCH|nr:Co2+/Mg2+ efflux protein ApaG [Hahella chejuensis]ABC32750.1 uncharacterized protein affecting Mg2+/Co2+ transport [Hahella chejuensis KCTC 2396]
MSETSLYDIRVSVRTQFIASQSDPDNNRFVFAYHITILNEGARAAQLLRRRWLIIDGDNKEQEVTGDGVVGQQPVIQPGASYEYSSGCVLDTEVGAMEGHYEMLADDGHLFNAEIPRFILAAPRVLH